MSDTVKIVFVYAMAATVIVGGGIMLFVSRNEANTDFALVVSGFMGSAIAFLFGQESATRAVRSYQNGLNTSVAPPEDGQG